MRQVISLLRRAWGSLGRHTIVPRSRGRLFGRDLFPLLMVLPIVAYAYLVQAVIVEKTRDHERDVRTQDLQSLHFRLGQLKRGTLATCRDYAHWDQTYHQVKSPEHSWMTSNMEIGLGNTFGFDLAVLQDEGGTVVWEKGLDDLIAADIERYDLLSRCVDGQETAGVLVLNNRVYVCAAVPILTSANEGPPHGMVFTATLADESMLHTLEAGSGRGLTLCQSNGQIIAFRGLGAVENLPRKVAEMLAGRYVPPEAELAVSKDTETSYGLVPIHDINGLPAGTIVEVCSRANLVSNLKAIKQMTAFLAVLCIGVGLAATSYFRNRALARVANRDRLTGLYNHGYLQEYLKNEVMRAQRYSRSLSVAMLDIDHFKVINDTYGHAVGDYVLRKLSEVVVSTVRETDLVARYGGEELLIVLPETNLSEAMASAERIRLAVQAHDFVASGPTQSRDTLEVNVTVSIGVAAFPEDGAEPAVLAAASDVALAAAKATRNTVVSYQDATEHTAEDGGQSRILEGFLRDSRLSVIRPLVSAINHRAPGSEMHSEKVASYAVQIGRELGWSTQDLAVACRAAMLMDVGKIGVPDSVLTKESTLSPEEMTIVRAHPAAGADIISRSPQLAQVSEIVKHHHERYDGLGYPDGLAGEEIPLISRVLSVADALVAMMSDRAYRQAKTAQHTIAELRAQSTKQFDPEVVEAAVHVIERALSSDNDQLSAA